MEHPLIGGLTDWQPLARGGVALVWRARQELLDRPVAVKVYLDELVAGESATFSREAAAIGRLSDHRGVVTAYAAGLLTDQRPYLIMELCPGGSLTQWLRPERRPTEEQVISIGIEVADAVAAAHRSGVVHRDVKPANILLGADGRPRLADFGLAALTGTGSVGTDGVRLTPSYAPPEAFDDPAPAPAGDVFSVAATLYALLTGRAPRQVGDEADGAEVREALREPIAPLLGVNWFLADVVMSGLSTDPADRPSATELVQRLRELAASPPAAPRAPRGRLVTTGTGVGGRQRVSESVHPARGPRRRGGAGRRPGLLTLSVALSAVAVSSTVWLLTEPTSSSAPVTALDAAAVAGTTPEPARTPVSADVSEPRPGPSAASRAPAAAAADVEIRVQAPRSAAPFHTVPVRGTFRGGAGTFVQVQRWQDGRWRDFPVPAKTDRTGAFTAYVELAESRRHRLRVVDHRSGVSSEPFVVVIAS